MDISDIHFLIQETFVFLYNQDLVTWIDVIVVSGVSLIVSEIAKASRHDICQMFYTSEFSIVLKFSQQTGIMFHHSRAGIVDGDNSNNNGIRDIIHCLLVY